MLANGNNFGKPYGLFYFKHLIPQGVKDILFNNLNARSPDKAFPYNKHIRVIGGGRMYKVKIKMLFAKVAVSTLALATLIMTGIMFSACTKGKEYTKTDPDVDKYVDLGLPSGVKWATCNLGAAKPSDEGDYYSWGETEPNKSDYSWESYKWMQEGTSSWNYITKYTIPDGQTSGIWYDIDGKFIGDDKTILEAVDDAATAKLGEPWRMPTSEEIRELLVKCSWTWSTKDGKNGYKVKGPNGNSIFLPASGYRYISELGYSGSYGYYWSGALNSRGNEIARCLCFHSGVRSWDLKVRYFGFTVRPVYP